MTIVLYIIVELISLLFLKLAEKYKTEKKHSRGTIKKSTICLIVSFIPLAALVCLRNVSVGTDTINYANVYMRIVNGTVSSMDLKWIGIGYRIVCNIVGFFVGNRYYILNIIVGFVTIYLFYKTVWENSKIPSLSIYFFISTCLYYQTFNQSRQMLAIAIVFYSIKYIQDRNFKKYLIYTLIASSIHSSAIIMIPFYFIGNMEINKKNNVKYIILAFILYFGMFYIRKLLLMTTYGQNYFGTDYDVEGRTSTIINLIVRTCLLIVAFIFGSKDSKEKYKYLYNLAIICTILQLLTINTYAFGRITTYFFTTYIILIPNIIPKKYNNIYQFILFIILALYHYVYYNATSVSMGVQTYKFLFN